jgi:phosphatidylglycerophosphatase A
MMNPKTDASTESTAAAQANLASSAPKRRKPYFSLFCATACGLGYLPKAPGTFGAFAGVVIAYALSHFDRLLIVVRYLLNGSRDPGFAPEIPFASRFYFLSANFIPSAFVFLAIGLIGVWTATRVERYSGAKDPQFVVIDEVSGQHLTLLLGSMMPLVGLFGARSHTAWSVMLYPKHPNWIILLVGLILFRVFDIWKPFPVRQAESLPAGWGIMADDWVAGIYAAIVLWLARIAGL